MYHPSPFNALQLLVCLLVVFHHAVFAVEGPKLTILNVTEQEIHVQWTPVTGPGAEKYQVSAYPTKSYGLMDKINRNEWTFSNLTTKSDLMGLHPGTLYNISVWAHTTKGVTEPSTEHVWTEIGAPDTPPPVEIIDRNKDKMTVLLPAGTSNNGPVTGVQVITLEKTPLTSFAEEELGSYHESQESGVPYYIAAYLTPEQANQTFVVGDKKMYGQYYNAPLLEDRDYEVLVGIISSLNGVTKVSYSSLRSTEGSSRVANEQLGPASSTLSSALSAAIGVFGFLLVLSVFVYFMLRKRYGRRRPSDELVLRVHGSEGEENGFLPGALHLDSETDLAEFYSQLKEHYWQIPRAQIEVHQSVLGIGQFGEVREGLVHRRSQAIPCLVQHAQTPETLCDKEKRSLLKELETMARTGFHPNVVEFIGACDERGILLVSIEHHSTSLRGLLLRSRQQNNGQISSLSEHHLLELCAGIAHGMAHLADRGIIHKHLSSRNILIADGAVPKIAHFGLGHYHPLGKRLGYTRWMAPECQNSNSFTSRSDVWSFGVVLWEVFTLGGSPFRLTPTRELLPRIMQGLRLQRPKGISDDLYQQMLHCWELDPDERPKFLELSSILQNFFLNAKDHVQFHDHVDFQHEKFDPNAEDE